MEQHLPDLIHDLGIILSAAGLVTLLFKRFRQPVVLGYIIAGFLVGPHFHFFPTIGDLPNVKVWAEIGVIFLLFALGLEFSFKKLLRVGGASSITAFTEVVVMILIGYFTGRLFNWNQMDSIFLGGILAISSTTIIIRAFEEVGVKGRSFVNLVFGVLIVEDLVAIVLLVILSTLAVKNQFEGVEMVGSIAKLGFFLTLWFVSGIFLIPSLLRKFRSYLNEETLLVLSLGFCFLMVILASKAGFSPALGAFIMGSIFAETTDAERIEHIIKPVKDLFAAIFFVSVGTLIDPNTLMQYGWPVLVITLVTIVGKVVSSTAGALLAGQPLRTSIQAGFSLAQIGEFSFIIAGLGLTLKVTSDFLYPVAVAVSAITTLTTPYIIKSADKAANFVDARLPDRWRRALDNYSSATRGVSTISEWRVVLRSYLLSIALNAILVTAAFLIVARYAPSYLGPMIGDSTLVDLFTLGIALMASAPFLWAWLLRKPARSKVASIWEKRNYRGLVVGLEAARYGSAVALFGFLSSQIVNATAAILITVIVTVLALVLFRRYWHSAYSWMEERFVANLSERETAHSPEPQLAPWDAHVAKLIVSPASDAVGKTLMDLKIRERFGVTIALLERGERVLHAPTRDERIYPFDKVSAIGSDSQIQALQSYLAPKDLQVGVAKGLDTYSLEPYLVKPGSPFVGHSIRNSGIREKANGLVVGVERKGERFLSPDSNMILEIDDHLWIFGDRQAIRLLNQ